MNVTFDTNCIIALDEDEDDAPYLRRIIQSAPEQGLTLRVVGISASERQPGGGHSKSFSDFQARIAGVGLGDVEILKPPVILGVTYWDHCILGCDEWTEEAKRIHDILSTASPFAYGDFCTRFGIDPEAQPLDGRWRNRAADTWGLWTHMHDGGGVFVTSDGDFLTKKEPLAGLGVGEILRPKEAAAKLCPG